MTSPSRGRPPETIRWTKDMFLPSWFSTFRYPALDPLGDKPPDLFSRLYASAAVVVSQPPPLIVPQVDVCSRKLHNRNRTHRYTPRQAEFGKFFSAASLAALARILATRSRVVSSIAVVYMHGGFLPASTHSAQIFGHGHGSLSRSMTCSCSPRSPCPWTWQLSSDPKKPPQVQRST